MLASMNSTIEEKRKTFGNAPIVTFVMARKSFDQYRAAISTQHQADLDAMVDAGTVEVRESSD
jgi:hypothetical protein